MGEFNNKSRAIVLGFYNISSPARTRTSDLVVNSHSLYRLSYGGIEFQYVVFYFKRGLSQGKRVSLSI